MSRPASVLIIDDDRGTCETLGDVLGLKGYAVETATAGRAALGKFGARPFDAAVVDIMLPDISGLDLLAAIRAASPDTEVIFITGHASLPTALQAINGAAFAYLVKPFEMEHLLAILAKALEKQRLTRALRESEERYRSLYEGVPVGLFRTLATDEVVEVNPTFAKMLGYANSEAMRGVNAVSFYVNPEDRLRWQSRLEREGVVADFEVQFRRLDGTSIWVRETARAVRDQLGQVIYYEGTSEDITERKRLQESLIQAEKLATLGELIAGIAHELNNPLSSVVGHAQLLRMEETDPKKAVRAERIIQAAQRATRIVRNFLTVVRKHRPEQVAVSVNDVIAKTVELFAYQLRVSNVEIETVLAPDLPQITGDPHQLQQVILNLLNNATQAIMGYRNHGRVRIATELSPDRSTIRINVADNGPGILPEHLSRIFEPFFTTKPAGVGTGLGLALIKGIMTEHGGTITVESTPGHGATFLITLPVTTPPPAAPPGPPTAAISPGLRVLVVDDEPPLRELMAEALMGQKAQVQTAANARQALEILAQSHVDVLVLDVRMPGVSGTDLWNEINRINSILARRTIFCTGDVVTEEVRAFIASVGCLTVSKPFELPQFFDAVARAASR